VKKSPSPAPAEIETMEPKNTVPVRRPSQQHSIETSEVDKDHTQSQSCTKSTIPILLGSSLSTHRVRPQDVCGNIDLTFTFCTEYFIRTILDHTRVQSNKAIQQWPYFMVAVDWSQPTEALSDVAAFASSVQTHNASDMVLDHCIVAFIDWDALVDLAKSDEMNLEAREMQRMTKGTMTIRNGSLIRFQYTNHRRVLFFLLRCDLQLHFNEHTLQFETRRELQKRRERRLRTKEGLQVGRPECDHIEPRTGSDYKAVFMYFRKRNEMGSAKPRVAVPNGEL
jgi:hypothetical protein